MERNRRHSFGKQNLLPANLTINPGDAFRTVCFFDTAGRTSDTFFADGSQDEMCITFLYTYPPSHGVHFGEEPFVFCGLSPNPEYFEELTNVSLVHYADTICGSRDIDESDFLEGYNTPDQVNVPIDEGEPDSIRKRKYASGPR
ncbi:MAG: hypothetical protein MHM6MM_003788 [Cercozoa sp. M6MM]